MEERIAELEAREREVFAREMRVKALEKLTEKGLPASLAGILNYEDEEKCLQSIDTVEEVLRGEVKKRVDARLPETRRSLPGGSVKDEDEMSDREYYSMKLGRK